MDIDASFVRDCVARIKRIKTNLLRECPFYGILLGRLKFSLDDSTKTVYTDGERIAFNPKFLALVDDISLRFILLHSVMHLALDHWERRNEFDPYIYDLAADIVVNSNIYHSLGDDESKICINIPSSYQSEYGDVTGVAPHRLPDGSEGYEYTAEYAYGVLAKAMGEKGEGDPDSWTEEEEYSDEDEESDDEGEDEKDGDEDDVSSEGYCGEGYGGEGEGGEGEGGEGEGSEGKGGERNDGGGDSSEEHGQEKGESGQEGKEKKSNTEKKPEGKADSKDSEEGEEKEISRKKKDAKNENKSSDHSSKGQNQNAQKNSIKSQPSFASAGSGMGIKRNVAKGRQAKVKSGRANYGNSSVNYFGQGKTHTKKSQGGGRKARRFDNHGEWGKKMDIGQRMKRSYEWKNSIKTTIGLLGNKSRGTIPYGALLKIKLDEKETKLDWKTILHDFLVVDEKDYSFTPPDKRYDSSPFFLPDFNPEDVTIKNILVFVDTSGSMDKRCVKEIVDEIKAAICDTSIKLKGWLSFFDAQVSEPVPINEETDMKKIKVRGGGGTSFEAVFEYVRNGFRYETEKNGEEIAAIVMITDGLCDYPNEEITEGIPVLWIMTSSLVAPWGKTVNFDFYGGENERF